MSMQFLGVSLMNWAQVAMTRAGMPVLEEQDAPLHNIEVLVSQKNLYWACQYYLE